MNKKSTNLKVAFQGMAGAYSNLACEICFPDAQPIACNSFEEMLNSTKNGETNYAMVPVENSVAGRVADIHHLIPESGLFIVGEHFQRVNHYLLGTKKLKNRRFKICKESCTGTCSMQKFYKQT